MYLLLNHLTYPLPHCSLSYKMHLSSRSISLSLSINLQSIAVGLYFKKGTIQYTCNKLQLGNINTLFTYIISLCHTHTYCPPNIWGVSSFISIQTLNWSPKIFSVRFFATNVYFIIPSRLHFPKILFTRINDMTLYEWITVVFVHHLPYYYSSLCVHFDISIDNR